MDKFELYICDDLNIDYSQVNIPAFKKLKSLEVKYNLTQLIERPTRYIASSKTILDLIFTNSNYIASAAPHKVNISDHEPVIAIRKLIRVKPSVLAISSRTIRQPLTAMTGQVFSLNLKWTHCWTNWRKSCLNLLTSTALIRPTQKGPNWPHG